MDEVLREGIEELKRLDHLIFVSLKYTRTVDVLRNVVGRLISLHEVIYDGMLNKMEEEGEIIEVPVAPVLKAKELKAKYPTDSQLHDYLNFYVFLRKLYRSEYTGREEFRRYVTLIATLPDGEVVEVDIDKVTEYYEDSKDFLYYIKGLYIKEDE